MVAFAITYLMAMHHVGTYGRGNKQEDACNYEYE
jgi:hypothetical protein